MSSVQRIGYIEGLYRTLLGREADAPGLMAWLNSPYNEEQLFSAFTSSPEYLERIKNAQASGFLDTVTNAKEEIKSIAESTAAKATESIVGNAVNTLNDKVQSHAQGLQDRASQLFNPQLKTTTSPTATIEPAKAAGAGLFLLIVGVVLFFYFKAKKS